MKHNLFISKLNEKDVNHFTTDVGLFLRRKSHKLFRKLCNFFTHTKVIYTEKSNYATDEEYYRTLNDGYISVSDYPISHNKNNVIVERYPQLKKDESYIFVGNHTCPEDIEIMLNVIDRNSYLILGSVESLKYNPEVYLSWLNGMIVFDVLDKTERSDLLPKMKRVLKTQSILIYPEGSHNYNPNKLINNLYDGPINMALETGKGIVPIIMIKDDTENIAYIDVGNPIYITKPPVISKKYIKDMSLFLRDKMATSVWYLISRHIKTINRKEHLDIGAMFIERYLADTFKKIDWKHDVFDAEYLTKKTKEEREYEEIMKSLSSLRLKKIVLKKTSLNSKEYIQMELDIDKNNVVENMRRYFYEKKSYKGGFEKYDFTDRA